jgi:signal recognition particle subunit SRP68
LSAILKGDDCQVFYSEKVNEIIPNIRYCNYNLGDETAKKDLVNMKLNAATGSDLADNIDALISQTKQNQIQTFSEINWRNKIPIQVKNEKVRGFLLNVQEYEKQIQASQKVDSKISIYENILRESLDIIQLTRDELKMDPGFQIIQSGQPLKADQKPSNLLLVFAYLTWLRITKTIERSILMLDSYKTQLAKQASANYNSSSEEKIKNVRPQDIVRLYDIILQNYRDLANLPGLSQDQQYQNDNELLVLFYKIFRAFYISLFYLTNKRYKEAVGFCFKVEKNVNDVRQGLKELSKTSDLVKTKSEMESKLDSLIKEINEFKYKIQTAAILEEDTGMDDKNAQMKETLQKKVNIIQKDK